MASPLPPDSGAGHAVPPRRETIIRGLVPGLHGRRLLLTGATGFFGLWLLRLIERLQDEGGAAEVTAVSRDPERFLARQPRYAGLPWLHWVRADVRDLAALRGQAFDLVLHAATDTSVEAGRRPLELFDTILGGARQVLELAAATPGARVLFTGSGAQYGPLPPGQPVREDAPLACASNSLASAYGEAKRAQETLAVAHAARSGLEVVFTRCFAFSGPGLPLDAHFAIGNFVRDALRAEAIVLKSSGEAVRSYLDGEDLAVWLLHLLLHGQSGQAYNVGSDQAVSIAGLAREVGARLAPHKPVRILGQPDGGQRLYYVPDIGRARALGLDVWIPLEQSIDRMGRWAGEENGQNA
jgi:nucleoside-diphosphate-sugar epimerase